MKISINSKDLLKVANLLSGLIKGNHTMPILDNVLVEVGGGKIAFTADNLETRARVELEVAAEGNATICIPFKLFSNVLKGFPNAPVELVFTDKNLCLNSSTGNYNIPVVNAAEFPIPKEKENISAIKINALEFKEGLRKALMFTEKRNITQYDSVLLNIQPDGIKIASTDGGAVIFEYSLEGSGEAIDMVISRNVATFLTQGINSDQEIEIGYSKNNIFLTLDNVEVAAILSDAKFPNYKAVFEKLSPDKTLKIDKELISSAIKRLVNISDESNNNIVFKIDNNTVEISFKNDMQKYDAKETLSCEYEGEPIVIGFNGGYINNMLTAIEEDINMQMSQKDRPSLFTAENIRAILAPILVK